MFRGALFSLFAIILTGCGAQMVDYGYRPNTTNQQKVADWGQCVSRASMQFPPNMQMGVTPSYTSPTYNTPTRTNCYSTGGFGYGNMSCTTTGGELRGGQTYGGTPYSYDANSGMRDSAAENCFMAMGYTLHSLPECRQNQVPTGLRVDPYHLIANPYGEVCVTRVNGLLTVLRVN